MEEFELNPLLFCETCNQDRAYTITETQMKYKVKNENFLIVGKKAYCSFCGDEVFDFDIEQENQEKAFHQYRLKHNLLQPNEITEIRSKYNLSSEEFSVLLGFKPKTISRFERGTIQTQSQNEKIALCDSIDNMKKFIEENKNRLPDDLTTKVLDVISNLQRETVIQLNEDEAIATITTSSRTVARTLKQAGFSPTKRKEGLWIFQIPIEAIEINKKLLEEII